MTRLLDSAKVDQEAVAIAVDGLRTRGATCQTYLRADGRNVCVNAVNAGGNGWSRYSEAASRRAALLDRRMLPVLDSGDIDGRLWIAYDMGSTTSLSDYRGRHLLPTATCLRVLSDVARALDGAAGDGVFPSELPPESVFVTGKGARLGDLGTALEALAGSRYELEGDPAYVPQEVLRGKRAGERSGVYLFGALLYHLLTGAPPPNGHSAPLAGSRPDLPASISSVVATAMADNPEIRPHSASEAHEMAKRALRGEPPVPARKRRAAKAAAAKRAEPKAAVPTPAAPKAAAPTPAAPKAAAAERAAPKRAASKADAPTRAAPRAAVPKRAAPKASAPKAATPRRVAAKPLIPRRAVAVGGALILGAAAGLLLGSSPEPEPARAETVTAGDLSVTLPSDRHRFHPGDRSLSVRAPGSVLRARVVNRPLEPRPEARPVELGALQAWRRAARGAVGYSIPTSRGTLEVTCRMTASETTRPLRLCERTASTLRLRDARALPLAAAAEDSRRLRTAIAALSAERDDARARLGRASTASKQRLVAQDLAASYGRAATVLHELAGAASIEAAVRGAANAYSRLAASAESGSAGRWNEASERVRRSEVMLAEAIAAAG